MKVHGRYSRLSAVLVAMLLAIPAAAQTGHSNPLARIRIDNFGRVNDSYYRGAQPVGQDYSDLAAIGIKTVIDLTMDGDASEAGTVEGLGMRFHRIPMTTRTVPTSVQIAEFLKLVNDPASQPVYVHCQGGRHRTGVMTAVYRMSQDGWAADRAFAEMKAFNYGPDFLHPEFKRFVYAYHVETVRPAAPVQQADLTPAAPAIPAAAPVLASASASVPAK